MTSPEPETLLDVCSADELAAVGRSVLQGPHGEILLLWNGGEPVALVNTCIHKQRRLSDGFLLMDRIVCAGHQWSFELRTGYCKERDKYQPRYEVRLADGRIGVATESLSAPSGMGPLGVMGGSSVARSRQA